MINSIIILFYSFFGYSASLRTGLLHQLFSSCREQGQTSGCSAWASHCGDFSCAAWTVGTWASVAAARGSVAVPCRIKSTGSIAVVHELSCSVAYGIFRDQKLNPCILHCQVHSLALSHQGSHQKYCFNFTVYFSLCAQR